MTTCSYAPVILKADRRDGFLNDAVFTLRPEPRGKPLSPAAKTKRSAQLLRSKSFNVVHFPVHLWLCDLNVQPTGRFSLYAYRIKARNKSRRTFYPFIVTYITTIVTKIVFLSVDKNPTACRVTEEPQSVNVGC